MKKAILFSLILALFGQYIGAQDKIWDETEAQKVQRMKWWTDARFGMFIHFGLYAQAGRHEWVKSYEKMTDEQYKIYFELFNPDLYNPREWARMAKNAGMKYGVITTKHHEGFCLFDSKYTDYDALNTPIKRDLIREYVDAFRAEGLGVGFYYSLIDWHHPDYTIDRWHPQVPGRNEDYEKLNQGRDMSKYREYLKNQVREILTNYGKIDIIWLDFSSPGEHGRGRDDWNSLELIKMVRKLQPQILVNDRLDLREYEGGWDFTTPEQTKMKTWPEYNGKKIPWETCQTFSGSWGYFRDEYTWKDKKQLLVLLIESVSKGGNLLLNVGPTGRGTFDYRAQKALAEMGEWMKVNSRAIYGCTQAPPEFKVPENSLLTYNPSTKRLYIHLLDYPLQRFILEGYDGKIRYAQFLHDASEIKYSKPRARWSDPSDMGKDLNLSLPVTKPNVEIPVIEIFLN